MSELRPTGSGTRTNKRLDKKGSQTQIQDPNRHRKPSNIRYLDMIIHALQELNDRNGSSRHAIMKCISKNYKVEESATTNSHVKRALKKGLSAGILKQTKGLGLTGSFRMSPEFEKALKAGGFEDQFGVRRFLQRAQLDVDTPPRVSSLTKAGVAKKKAGKRKPVKRVKKRPVKGASEPVAPFPTAPPEADCPLDCKRSCGSLRDDYSHSSGSTIAKPNRRGDGDSSTSSSASSSSSSSASDSESGLSSIPSDGPSTSKGRARDESPSDRDRGDEHGAYGVRKDAKRIRKDD